MTTSVYKIENIHLIDGTEIELSPLKIKYLKEFMDAFKRAQVNSKSQDEALDALIDCVRIAMKQFYPSLKTHNDIEDNFDLKTMYKVLQIVAGIKMGESTNRQQVVDSTEQAAAEKSSWEDLDLAKIEAQVFVMGMWKNYEELEVNMSMPELLITLETSRELDYNEKKFLAAMQGVDLDEELGIKEQEVDPWEAMKARVATGGLTSDPNDIISYQGIRAAQSGFGVGMGLEYSTEL